MKPGVSTAAAIHALTEGLRALHAEDQRLQLLLKQIHSAGQVSAEDFEAILEAQRTALRVPANALLMLVGWLEAQETDSDRRTREKAAAPTFRLRLRRAARAFTAS